MTIVDIQSKIQDIQVALSANPEPGTRKKLEQGLEIFQSLLLAEQKKSESQSQPPAKPEQLPDMEQRREQENKREWFQEKQKQANYAHIESGHKQPDSKTYTTQSEGIKTVKAPAFVAPDELINVTLENSEGEEYIRTHTKAQVRALARKYFSNVHESWQGKEKKMKRGFKNMLAYVVAWKDFEKGMPSLRDVLPDYDHYSKGGEDKQPSEAFKVAQELYGKILEILNKEK